MVGFLHRTSRNNLHPARGRILPVNDFADGDLRIETIYTPQGDEYLHATDQNISHCETIYTPQGDEYYRLHSFL